MSYSSYVLIFIFIAAHWFALILANFKSSVRLVDIIMNFKPILFRNNLTTQVALNKHNVPLDQFEVVYLTQIDQAGYEHHQDRWQHVVEFTKIVLEVADH